MEPNIDQKFEISPDVLIASYRGELASSNDRLTTLLAAANMERGRREAIEAQLSHILGELPALAGFAGVLSENIESFVLDLVAGRSLADALAEAQTSEEPAENTEEGSEE